MIPRSIRQRRVFVTFLVAGIGAIIAEHALKPQLKRKLKIK